MCGSPLAPPQVGAADPRLQHEIRLAAEGLGGRPAWKPKLIRSYLKQQSKHFISIKHVVLVSQWNDEKTFKKNKMSLIPTNSREVFKAI